MVVATLPYEQQAQPSGLGFHPVLTLSRGQGASPGFTGPPDPPEQWPPAANLVISLPAEPPGPPPGAPPPRRELTTIRRAASETL